METRATVVTATGEKYEVLQSTAASLANMSCDLKQEHLLEEVMQAQEIAKMVIKLNLGGRICDRQNFAEIRAGQNVFTVKRMESIFEFMAILRDNGYYAQYDFDGGVFYKRG